MKLFVKEFLFYGVILPVIEKERTTKGLESLSIPKSSPSQAQGNSSLFLDNWNRYQENIPSIRVVK